FASTTGVGESRANQRLKLTGAAILVFRGSASLQAAPAAWRLFQNAMLAVHKRRSPMKPNAVSVAVVACAGVAVCGVVKINVAGGEPPADKRDAPWVPKRAAPWQPAAEGRAFHEIGWANDLGEAQRLGKQHNRPVFLFTYDGASLSGYRC